MYIYHALPCPYHIRLFATHACWLRYYHVPITVAVTWIICCKIKMLTLNEHDLTVDQVPPNRALLVQPHLHVRAGLGLGYRSAFYGYHQRGEVMHARYPGPVGGDNL